MLTFLNIVQLLLYVALLALVGQGILHFLAGPKRETNLFYGALRVVAKPFTLVVRKLTPKTVADAHVPLVTFFLLLVVYAVVTFEKINRCVAAGMKVCQ